MTDISTSTEPSRLLSKRTLMFGLGILFLGAVGGYFYLRESISSMDPANPLRKKITVQTVFPAKQTLVRGLDLPGTVQASSQAEIYSKVSGYLRRMKRDVDALTVARFLLTIPTVFGMGDANQPTMLLAMQATVLETAPEIDIGSPIFANELLVEIDAPDLVQEIFQKQSLLQQTLAEVEQARSNVTTAEAAVTSAKAQIVQAQAEIRRSESEREFRNKEIERLKTLVFDKVINPEILDEKQNQVNAAKALVEVNQAKLQVSQADWALISSKLTAAQADLKIRESKVKIAEGDLRKARIMADFAVIRAPFAGVLTSRQVDQGDFVQNSSSGQTRRLMTVASIDQVKVVFQVPEKECPWIRLGIPATVRLDSKKAEDFAGRISRMSYSLDPHTRTMQVEIDLPNANRKLLPGMYVQVSVLLEKTDGAFVVPASAVYTKKRENYIFSVSKEGVVKREIVRVNFDDGKMMEVIKLQDGNELPLTSNDELIVNLKSDLADGQKVRVNRPTASLSRMNHENPPLVLALSRHDAAGAVRMPPSCTAAIDRAPCAVRRMLGRSGESLET